MSENEEEIDDFAEAKKQLFASPVSEAIKTTKEELVVREFETDNLIVIEDEFCPETKEQKIDVTYDNPPIPLENVYEGTIVDRNEFFSNGEKNIKSTFEKHEKRIINDPVPEKMAGYNVVNLLNNDDVFFTTKSRVINLNFKLQDIVEIDNSEVMKILFNNGWTMRVIKYENEKGQAVAIFDIVDEKKKEIITKSDREFIRGLGIADLFFGMNMINQWEIPVLTKLLLGFVHGDAEIFQTLIKKYHLKISRESEWYLRMRLGIE